MFFESIEVFSFANFVVWKRKKKCCVKWTSSTFTHNYIDLAYINLMSDPSPSHP